MIGTQDEFIYSQNQINSLEPFNIIFNSQENINPEIEDDASLDDKIYFRNQNLDCIDLSGQDNSMSIEKEEKSENQEMAKNEKFKEVEEKTNQITPDNKTKIFDVKKIENKTKEVEINKIIEQEQNIDSNEDLLIFTKPKIFYSDDYLKEPEFECYYDYVDEKKKIEIKEEFNTKLFYIGSMYKKVRGKVFKIIKNYFNKKFEKYGIKNEFSFKDTNQNMSKTTNKYYLNMTLKELLKYIKDDNGRYILNEETEKILAILEKDNNDKMCGILLNTKIEEIYKKYFKSNEYQELIKELIDSNNNKYNYDYIHLFVKRMEKFVEYYKKAEEHEFEE